MNIDLWILSCGFGVPALAKDYSLECAPCSLRTGVVLQTSGKVKPSLSCSLPLTLQIPIVSLPGKSPWL